MHGVWVVSDVTGARYSNRADTLFLRGWEGDMYRLFMYVFLMLQVSGMVTEQTLFILGAGGEIGTEFLYAWGKRIGLKL